MNINVFLKDSVHPMRPDYVIEIEDKKEGGGWDRIWAEQRVEGWGQYGFVNINNLYIPMHHVRQITLQ